MWSVPWARLHLCCEEVSIIYNMYFQLTFHCHAHQINYELATLVIVISHKDIRILKVSPPTPSPYFCYGGPVGRGCHYIQIAVLRSCIVPICCNPQLQPLELQQPGNPVAQISSRPDLPSFRFAAERTMGWR